MSDLIREMVNRKETIDEEFSKINELKPEGFQKAVAPGVIKKPMTLPSKLRESIEKLWKLQSKLEEAQREMERKLMEELNLEKAPSKELADLRAKIMAEMTKAKISEAELKDVVVKMYGRELKPKAVDVIDALANELSAKIIKRLREQEEEMRRISYYLQVKGKATEAKIIESVWDKIKNWFSGVIAKIKDWVSDFSNTVQKFKNAVEGAIEEKKEVNEQWETLPKGWTQKSLEQFARSLTHKTKGDPEGFVRACMVKMEGKVDNPAAFCSSLKDKFLGKTTWRGKESKEETKGEGIIEQEEKGPQFDWIFYKDGRPVEKRRGSYSDAVNYASEQGYETFKKKTWTMILPKELEVAGDAKISEIRVAEQEKTEEAKVYLGSYGEDRQYYLVKEKNDAGDLEDIKIVDAEGNKVYSAKEANEDADLSDEQAILKDAIQKIDLDSISYDIFMKYFWPEEEKEEEVKPEGETEEKPKEEEENEENEEKPETEEEPKEEEEQSAVETPEETKEGRVPEHPDDTEDTMKALYEKEEEEIIEELLKKYSLK